MQGSIGDLKEKFLVEETSREDPKEILVVKKKDLIKEYSARIVSDEHLNASFRHG